MSNPHPSYMIDRALQAIPNFAQIRHVT